MRHPQQAPVSSSATRVAKIETAAFYGAFTLMTAIVVGTLSLHPF